eukprot:CAMPEP_0172534832 /NCGR_PEP_ID=MMETSP1067-20121228/7057_1 /TAXON_ID=265564 ORGANISM="Thalassiosira punctigera, Strain Tpunct2005C2" /NCGR_SAMPLE_ID=MMETSP1067 /ASSEMBLY_ACC=CAM_ASM_000444 /LENGTH=970 /DNA_ID=CAMNT_0013319677 /DNA_START=43 /DNA_END=2955 /DNA_ORIENTATION=-
MRNMIGTNTSACGNVNDVAGGRKTTEPIAGTEGAEQGAVFVNLDSDDAVVFSDDVEVESVPSLDSESDDEEEEEEEEEEEWDSDEEEEEEDEEDAELDEGLAERRRILADARALKALAVAFGHPEVGVTSADGACFGRNYFGRPSALETEEDEFADERAEILEEAAALKKLAADYAHPEVGVTAADATVFGRNYFGRPSAPEMEDVENAEERARVLAEAAALKESAVDYLHPEVGVTSADGACFGRNYFDRPLAPETEDMEDAEERACVLAEAAALKKSAVDYMHPEVGVTATDGACFGRNYFERPSAVEMEEDEFADERAEILEEAAALKKLAVDYMHPEVGVTATDATVLGRNYFNRPSAPETEDEEDAEERARVLADALALKKSAIDYMHPEVGVTSADGACFGRNYFDRPAAVEMEDDEFADERAAILEEAAALKKLAADYMHPEVGVTATDATLFGRNYFNRPSAPETEDEEDAEERARVLAEVAALKKSAVDYMHPELCVTSADGACFGRNFFDRPTAPETEEDEFADERAEILEEVAALKKLATDYMHPEVCVAATDATVFGRNYFNRPSAPKTEEEEDAEERARVLADAAALKKLAIDFMHPEVGVTSADGACFGRNFFNRPSAPETEEEEDAEERARVLAEAATLKKSAIDYMHPEVGVTTTDATAFARNYFNRYSAPETEEDEFADERAEVLAEAAALKKLAADYMHPEVGVSATDATVFGRNYFNRSSAPEAEDVEEAEERVRVLAEAAALKKSAVAYMHPEVGVAATDATVYGRNYFNRLSAPEVEDVEDAEERALALADAAALKKSAVDYMHPEAGVTSVDAACFGRNYFSRPSAPETEEVELGEERARVLAEAISLKKSAVDYMHPEVGVTTTDATVFGRNYFNRYSSPEADAPKKQTETPEASGDVAVVKNLAAAVKGANLPSTKSTKLSSSDSDAGVAKKSESSVNLFGLGEVF